MHVIVVEKCLLMNIIETNIWSTHDVSTKETESIHATSVIVRSRNGIDCGYISCTFMRSTALTSAQSVASVSPSRRVSTSICECTAVNALTSVHTVPRHLQPRQYCAPMFVNTVERNLLNVVTVVRPLPHTLHMIATCDARTPRKSPVCANTAARRLRSHTNSNFTWICTRATSLTLVNVAVGDFQVHHREIDTDLTLIAQLAKTARQKLWRGAQNPWESVMILKVTLACCELCSLFHCLHQLKDYFR